MTRDRACPVCRGDRKEALYRQRFAEVSGQLQLAGYVVALCERCGAAYADDIPGQKWFDAYYRAVSKYTHDQRDGAEPAADTARFRDIATFIAAHLPDTQSRILDFGCASAGLLRQFKDRGYSELLGLDPSPSSAEVAQRQHGIRVVTWGLAEVAQREPPFDLLIQVGVLEHIEDVDGALAAMREVLTEGALTYVEVPDVVGFADWPGAPFQQFSIEHVNFFSRESLTHLMTRMGFVPVEVVRSARAHSADAQMPVVYGLFRLAPHASAPQSVEDGSRDESTGPALRRYIAQGEQVERRIAGVIDALVATQEPLLVWGVGTHTLHLMETTAFTRINAVAFVDSNPGYQSRELHGRPVIRPDAAREFPHRILISSQVFQSEIQQQITERLRMPNETILLYDGAAAPVSGPAGDAARV